MSKLLHLFRGAPGSYYFTGEVACDDCGKVGGSLAMGNHDCNGSKIPGNYMHEDDWKKGVVKHDISTDSLVNGV